MSPYTDILKKNMNIEMSTKILITYPNFTEYST